MMSDRSGLGTLTKGRRHLSRELRNPRQFLQLVPPMALVLAGWLMMVAGWQRSGLILVSAALIVFLLLLWVRLRKLQKRMDKGFRLVAARERTALAGLAPAPVPVLGPPGGASGDGGDPRPSEVDEGPTGLDEAGSARAIALWEVSGLMAGVPIGLLKALGAAAPLGAEEALLVVPGNTPSAVRKWVPRETPALWTVVNEQMLDATQRSRAATLDVIVIVDGGSYPTYAGVLDQSFFWWLPHTARLLLVSRDVDAFTARLEKAHGVSFLLTQAGQGYSRAAVTRARD